MLSLIDILVDGEFHTLEKDLTLRFRGSANQRVLDVKRSLEEKKPVFSEYNDREKLG
jgi:anaerobic ribonucleoside-triphosphate reductase activating protein